MQNEYPNLVSKGPAEKIAESVARPIRDKAFSTHVQSLLLNDLTRDWKNARAATKKEAANAEGGDWAVRDMAKGRPVHSIIVRRPRRRRLARMRELLTPFTYAKLRGDAEQVAKAKRLIAKAPHMSLKDLEAALEDYQPVWLDYQAIIAAEDERAIFDADECFSPSGNRWGIVPSKGVLGRVGMALNICVAPKRAYHLIYARAMMAGTVALWALYTPTGQCIGLASIDLRTRRLEQAKGYRNGPIGDPCDVPALLAYLNMQPRQPDPDRTPPHVMANRANERWRLVASLTEQNARRSLQVA